MRHVAYGAFWIGLYFVLAASPLLVLLLGHAPPGRGFWRELSMGLGFAGLSMMGLQFFLTGRFKTITAPYGIDVVYHFHRLISFIAFLFIFLHPLLLLWTSPATAALLDPLSAPWWITAGSGGLAAFAVVIATSLFRLRLKLSYELWRAVHGTLAVAAVALALTHIAGVGYYVAEPIKRWLWTGMMLAWLLALVWVRILAPALMLRHPYTVTAVRPERGNSWTLDLRPDGHQGMSFQPGQFAWLTLDRSPFSIREHPFSFSSSAMHPELLSITIKELGDFTSTIGTVSPGTRAFLDGPYGTFSIDRHPAPGYVFIAGGVGITPIMSTLRTMAQRGDRRPLLLFYGNRTRDEITFREELEELRHSLDLRVVHILREPPDNWDGERGYLSTDILARHLPAQRLAYEYFVCGPYPMQMAVKKSLGELGLPMEKVQSESFNFV